MERLTEHHVNKLLGAYMVCSGACIDNDFDCNACPKLMEIVDHLAAYEDTNLTPSDINDLHNELCLKCGKYKDAHLGACDGCRWRKEEAQNENN